MKEYFLVSLLMLTTLWGQTQILTFKSSKYGYSINKPNDFEQVSATGIHIDYKVVNKDGSSITVLVSKRLPEEQNIDGWSYSKDYFEKVFSSQESISIISKTEKIILDGKKTFLIYYSYPSGTGTNLKVIEAYLFVENNAYVITATSDEQHYEAHKTAFLETIQSIRFIQTQSTSATTLISKEASKSTVKTSSTSSEIKDNSTTSKDETEQWILSKLRNYAPKSYDVPIDKQKTWEGVAWVVKDISFSFDAYNLVINYSHAQPDRFGINNKEESKIFYKITIPIYAIERIYNSNNDLGFDTDGNVITEENVTEAKKSVTSFTFIPFNSTSETDLVKRLEKAFRHLKKFYTKPDNKELF